MLGQGHTKVMDAKVGHAPPQVLLPLTVNLDGLPALPRAATTNQLNGSVA